MKTDRHWIFGYHSALCFPRTLRISGPHWTALDRTSTFCPGRFLIFEDATVFPVLPFFYPEDLTMLDRFCFSVPDYFYSFNDI